MIIMGFVLTVLGLLMRMPLVLTIGLLIFVIGVVFACTSIDGDRNWY